MPRLAAFLSFFLLALAGAGALAQEEGALQRLPGENGEVYALNQEDLWYLTTLVRLCARETDALLKCGGTPRRPLQFLGLRREYREEEFRGGDIPVPLSASASLQLLRLCQGLLWRRMREAVPPGQEATPPPFLPLLAAGVAGRILYGGVARQGYYLRDFRIPRWQFQRRHFPALRRLLEMPVPSDHPALLRLYLAHANLFLDLLLENTDSLPALLEAWRRAAEQPGLSSLQALAQCLPIPGNPQDWYETHARETARDRQRKNNAAALAGELEEILTVSLLSANPSQGLLQVHLEEVPRKLQDYRLDDSALAALQTRLLRLQLSAPILLQEAVGEYLAAVEAFRNRDFRSFHSRLQRARRRLEQDCRRQCRAEELLQEDEDGDVTRESLWADWLEAWGRARLLWEACPPWGLPGRPLP